MCSWDVLVTFLALCGSVMCQCDLDDPVEGYLGLQVSCDLSYVRLRSVM